MCLIVIFMFLYTSLRHPATQLIASISDLVIDRLPGGCMNGTAPFGDTPSRSFPIFGTPVTEFHVEAPRERSSPLFDSMFNNDSCGRHQHGSDRHGAFHSCNKNVNGVHYPDIHEVSDLSCYHVESLIV